MRVAHHENRQVLNTNLLFRFYPKTDSSFALDDDLTQRNLLFAMAINSIFGPN